MARDVVTKKGEVVRLLNPYEKSKKYAYELKHQILITNFKDVKKNKDGSPKRISDSQISFRRGYLKARSDNAKAYKHNNSKMVGAIPRKSNSVIVPDPFK